MNDKKKIIITGGAGYIGSHTILDLIQSGHFEVVSIDNFCNSSKDTFRRIKEISGVNIKNYNIDICNKEDLDEIFSIEKNIVGVIHFAAFKSVGESVLKPGKYYTNNIISLVNILDCCIEYKIESIIFSSSCSVYGNIEELPVKEDTKLGPPESPYAYTKQIGEKIVQDYCVANSSLQIIALRYFNPVGAHISGKIGENPINTPSNLVPVITRTAVGKNEKITVYGTDYNTRDGSCIRDYVHVMDIAAAHVKAMEYLLDKKNKQQYSIYNLGTGRGVTVLEAIGAFEKVSGCKLNYELGPRRPGDVVAIFSDTGKMKNDLRWETKYSLDDMMQTAWQWEQYLKDQEK